MPASNCATYPWEELPLKKVPVDTTVWPFAPKPLQTLLGKALPRSITIEPDPSAPVLQIPPPFHHPKREEEETSLETSSKTRSC